MSSERDPHRIWPVLISAGLISLMALGCGAGGETTVTTVTETEGNSSPPAHDTLSSAEKAEDTVRRYYNAINRGELAEAWSLLTPGLQEELGGLPSWREGYETTVSTQTSGIDALEANARSALVSVHIRATDIDECGSTVHQSFSGTWSMELDRGRFRATEFDVEKTGGGTPVLDPGACEGSSSGYEVSGEPSGCDPNYTGCVPESSLDVDCDEVGEEVEVVGEDVYGLDLEEDGYACESYG